MEKVAIWSHRDLGIGDSDFKCAMENPLFPGDKSHAIFFQNDPSHGMKKGAASIHSSGNQSWHTRHCLKTMEDGSVKYLDWNMFKKAWDKDREGSKGFTALLPKITREHIERNGFTRLKVSFSAQMLSDSMARALEEYVGDEAKALIEYVTLFDEFFDIMNSGLYRKKWDGDTDAWKRTLATPITSLDDGRLQHLLDFIKYFEDWEASNKAMPAATEKIRSQRFITWQLFADLRTSVRT
jgi:hypothetical protein